MIRPLFIVVLILSAAAWPATSQQYTWDQVLIGGGGAIPTTVAHPTAKDVVFTTHDVCGPYRYNAARGRFEYLCGQFGWETMESRQYHGTECLVVDPTDATGNTIYATLGEWAFRPEGHGFFKSLDRGTTWTKANYPGIMTATDQFGAVQHICVDPANPQVIYHANRKGGLYRSTDGGASFTKTTAPEGDLTNWDEQKGSSGVRIVAVNPGTGTVTGPVRSKIVWINVATGPWETALWESTDGGESFHAMNAPCVNAMRIVCRDDGSALFASSNGLWKWVGGSMSEISPGDGGFTGVAVDPNDRNRIVTIGGKDDFHYSTNGGVSWTALNPKSRWHKAAAWYPDWLVGVNNAAHPFTGSLAFDADGNFWYSDWYQVWRCTNPGASAVDYYSMIKGIEEMVCIGQSVACPPSGDNFLYVGVADDWGFGIRSLNDFPATSLADIGVNVLSFDYRESDPSFVVCCGMEGWNGNAGGGYSLDGGKTWKRFTSIPSGTNGGRVAVSANSERIQWQHSGGLFYSTNRGSSWTQSQGVGGWGQSQIFNSPETYLVADRRNGNRFYRLNSTIWRSTDGGATWQSGSGAGLDLKNLFVNFLHEGEVWAVDWNGGLHRSLDGGGTLDKISTITGVLDANFGKGPSPDVASLYAMGKIDGTTGIYRSDDYGATWIDISDRLRLPGNDPSHIIGDRQVFGRCYVTTGGTGVFYGTPAGTIDTTIPPPPPPPASQDTARAVLCASIIVDGTGESEWERACAHADSHVTAGSVASGSDCSLSFRLAWNDESLSLLAEVTDDVAGISAANSWDDDGVELYIDATGNRPSTYGAGQFQYLFSRASVTVTEFKHDATGGVQVAQQETGQGYIIEAAIPWTTLGVTPEAEMKLGFDIQVNDNDGSGREGKIAWHATADNSYISPSNFGLLRLDDAATRSRAAKTAVRSGSIHAGMTANGQMTIRADWDGIKAFEIYDARGRQVWARLSASRVVVVPRHRLSPGNYVASVRWADGESRVRLVMP